MTKGRMLHGILPFFCAAALLRGRACGVRTQPRPLVSRRIEPPKSVTGLVSSDLLRRLGLSKAYFDVLLLLLRDDGVRVDRLVDQSPSFFPHGGLAAVLQGDGARRAAAVRLLGRIGALRTIDTRTKTPPPRRAADLRTRA